MLAAAPRFLGISSLSTAGELADVGRWPVVYVSPVARRTAGNGHSHTPRNISTVSVCWR